MNWQEKHAVITGASSGIGNAIAREFLKQGCKAVCLCARREEKLQQSIDTWKQQGIIKENQQCYPIVLDLSKEDSVDEAAKKCKEVLQNKVDFLINCSGTFGKAVSAVEADVEMWKNTMMVNLVNGMRFTGRILPSMTQHSSKDIEKVSDFPAKAIINIASMSVTVTSAKSSQYKASKQGLLGFSQNLFEDVREYGIKVSAICPGYVNTEMIDGDELNRDKMIQPEDVADTCMFIVKSSMHCCPTEIYLRPQFNAKK